MRVLVTGSDGFVGRHLVRTLRERGDVALEWSGLEKSDGVDVRDATAVHASIASTTPDAIIHLAGQSSVGRSHGSPAESFEVNTTGTVNVLHAVRVASPRTRVLLVSSGEVYGAVQGDAPADETLPLHPRSPYAASKAAAELAGHQFHLSYGLDVLSARPFNHLGAGQAHHFVVPSFARQIAAARMSADEKVLYTGDLSPVRDFSHVADVVDGYLTLLTRGSAGRVYNVASGQGVSIGAVLQRMLSLAALPMRQEVDPSRVRPVEVSSLVGDASALRALGWQPRRTLDQALHEVLTEHSAI